MKKLKSLLAVMALAVSALALTSCGSNVTLSGGIDENGKEATYTASKADEDDFVLGGTLIVGEDEQIVIDSNLEKGAMQFEFISAEGMDDIEEVPDTEGTEAVYTANVSEAESHSVWFDAGEYLVRATVTEGKTTGTVGITVKGFDAE